MRKTTRLIAMVLCTFALLALGCGDADNDDKPGTGSDITKEEAAQMQGKSDTGVDLCDFLGWYGDGICDDFCLLPDPDCGVSSCVSDSDCASGQVCDSGSCVAANDDCGGFAGLTCSSGEFCSYAAEDICGAADQMGTCEPIPDVCPEIYLPVCGCDGNTYSNWCHANGAGTSVASEGPCADQCTSDSDCAAGQACQSGSCVASTEDCGGRAGLTCATDQFCSYAPDADCGAADKTGTCTPRPEACAQIYDPVCGCDGQTYGNACTANAAGVSVASQGECATACTFDTDCADGQDCVDGTCQESVFCGGFAGFTCGADEWCEYDDSTGTACGAADGGGTCQTRPEACAQIFEPVCGCDGMTYSNECMANAAGTDIWATGPCN